MIARNVTVSLLLCAIVPPVASVAKDRVYSASASSKAGGRITLTILEVAP